MLSKKQERETLAKIEQILSETEGGYVTHAFEGCVEDARENIESDFWQSYKGRYENMCRKYEELQKCHDDAVRIGKERQDRIAQLESERVTLDFALDVAKKNGDELMEKGEQLQSQIAMLEVEKEDLQFQIIRLKAKLYDLTVSE